jgi:Flp pilus assembly protein CpaB
VQTVQRPPTANNKPGGKKGQSDLSKLLSTRGGLAAVAAFAAIVGGLLLLVFLQRYRASLTDKSTRTVLVARSLIPKGSDGDVIASQGLFQTTQVPGNQVKSGAITDPASLQGKVTATSVYPGQQLTTSAFAPSSNAVNTKIAGAQRAISIPLDSAHGMIGDVKAGDHVDVYASFGSNNKGGSGSAGSGRTVNVVKVLLRDAIVLRAPDSAKGTGVGAGPNSTQNVVLQTPDSITPQVAYTVDNGLAWIVERPQAGAKDSNVSTATLQSILGGVRPVVIGGKK